MKAVEAIPGDPSVERLGERLERLETEVRLLVARVEDLEQAGSEFRRTLNRLGDALSSTHDRPAMLAAVLETCALFGRASSAVFYAVIAGVGRLRPLATYGRGLPEGQALPELRVGEGLAGAAAAAEEVVVWPDSAVPEHQPSPLEPAVRSAGVAIPVRPGNRLFGVVALYDRSVARLFSSDDVQDLAALVRQVEPAIENTFLYEEATRLAITDGLTSLWNRRQFDLRLAAEHQRAVRFMEPFSIILLDLDQLKQVNDGLGHQAGDALLIEVSRRLSGGVRDVDLVARFGGDEFGLILPNTALPGAVALAEKLRAAIGNQPYDLKEGDPVQVTASIGVASYPEHADNARDLVKAADEALYRAKAGGKNRVERARVTE